MGVPWLRLLDVAINVASARSRKALAPGTQPAAVDQRMLGGLETRLAGVVVAALKEAFDRDTRRLELEREQLEAERQRAERLLRLELLRQAADREIGRLRLLCGVAAVSWLGTLVLAFAIRGGTTGARVVVGVGFVCLLAAFATAFAAQGAIEEQLRRSAEHPTTPDAALEPTAAALTAPWLIVVGLAFVAVAAII
jgi:hypothetical protein